MFNSLLFNTYLLLTVPVPQSTTFSESNNILLVSLILLILLLGSLVLTFHAKGTTVHKVLGLLLVSIFVVFLWTLQTQFLFIYIVYILAFISAVLMLFLSVVLMLPISTLTTKSFKNSPVLLVVFTQYSFVEFSAILLAISLILLTIFVSYTVYLFVMLHGGISKYSKWFDKLYNEAATEESNTFWVKIKDLLNEYKLFKNVVVNYLVKITYIALKVLFTLVMSVYTYCLSTKQSIHKLIYLFSEFLLNSHYVVNENFKQLIDVVLQSYLFINVILGLLVLHIHKQFQPLFNATELSLELHQGIGQLKTLLYGDFSLFLIFSTIVLLVALLGAAVMTRSKR
jgi:NADH:ubiquinone oxidoreductase subunit 6 (subunit J)